MKIPKFSVAMCHMMWCVAITALVWCAGCGGGDDSSPVASAGPTATNAPNSDSKAVTPSPGNSAAAGGAMPPGGAPGQPGGPGGAMPPGGAPGQPGGAMPPGGAPGQPGGQGGFPGAAGQHVDEKSAKYAVQQFAKKILAGETTDLSDLISTKAKDWLKKLRDGESVPERLEKLKTALTNAQITADKQANSIHIIVMEEGSGGGPGNALAGGNGAYGNGEGGGKKRKPGKRAQFKVVKEHDKFVILEVKVQ